ncbi:major facilitator superfamily domain-containing protein [Radiomyces spectabilis]|uniref:major facilitator superfamily domain-containing protein n=1 Tax=Radiomyces spectabilis TaxID=64574 RepID=UPI002220685D|nr:major facilitator superfamily domain-containing protein [Radiomyces spectabilis]KAI8393539.1 major facilitator superfamily domain-containing protein [Radiomyces spectabilis]
MIISDNRSLESLTVNNSEDKSVSVMTHSSVQQGVMQDSYEQKMFPSQTIALSFIGTIANILVNILGPFAQVLLSVIKARTLLISAVLCCVAGLEFASLSTKIWHLYLTQGALYGVGAAIIFYVTTSQVPQWFTKHRGTALGISSCGPSIGGLVMPFIMTSMNEQLGIQRCYRIMGWISLFVGLPTCLLFKVRRPTNASSEPSHDQEDVPPMKLKDVVEWSVLKDFNFIIWCMSDILMESAFNIPYFFLPSHATYLGLTSYQGSALICVASGLNSVGRILGGLAADRFGHMNTIIFGSLLAGVSSLTIWTLSHDFAMLMAYSSIFGFFGGAFISLAPSVTATITGMEKFESGFSLFLVVTVISMFGPNIAGAIEESVQTPPFFSYSILTGAAYILGVLLVVYLKLRLQPRLRAKI